MAHKHIIALEKLIPQLEAQFDKLPRGQVAERAQLRTRIDEKKLAYEEYAGKPYQPKHKTLTAQQMRERDTGFVYNENMKIGCYDERKVRE